MTPTKLEINEALAQMKDLVLMECAQIAYRQGETNPQCTECCNAIADAIRGLMREQR